MVQPQNPASFFVDDLVEGGGPPVQQNLTIQGAKFELFDYGGRVKPVTSLRLDLLTDDGRVLTQNYSVGDPTRIQHTPDGESLTIPSTKTSFFGRLMIALSNAGFPEQHLKAGRISCLIGLYAYWDAEVVKMTGLPGTTGTTERTVAVPTVIHRLPGQAGAPPAAPPMPPAAPPMPGASPMAPPPPVAMAPPAPVAAPVAMAVAPVAPVAVAPVAPVAMAPVAMAPVAMAPPLAPMAPPVAPAAPPMAPVAVAPVAAAPSMAQHLVTFLPQMGGQFTRQALMMKAFEAFAGNPPVQEALTNYVFEAQCIADLVTMGYRVDDNTVTYVGAPA